MAGQPNILMIMSDDHGQWAAGCYGNREIRTPALDHLAATGVRMQNAFTPTPVCSPARASFWTGLLPSQHGIHDFLKTVDPEIAARDWLRGQTTLAHLLHDAGYCTGLVGKWHIGLDDQHQPGFDDWFSIGMAIPRHSGVNEYFWGDRRIERSGYMTQVLTDEAVRFLRSRGESPFFLYVGYVATHSPWQGHQERLVSQYRGCEAADIPDGGAWPFGRPALESTLPTRNQPREALAQYYASISGIDEGIGRLLDELEAQGLREKTLVVYTSDHGLNCGHHGIWGKGNSTVPLNMVEESIRVPLIFNQPGLAGARQAPAALVDHCDLFATLLEYAGAALPAGPTRYPGRSFLPELKGAGPISGWKTAQMGEYGNLRMIRTTTHKLVRRYPEGPCELHDLEADPRETVNLFSSPDHQALVEQLTAELEEYFRLHETSEWSGLRVRELPRHNPVEAWRIS